MIKIKFILDRGAASFEREWPAVPRVGDGIMFQEIPEAAGVYNVTETMWGDFPEEGGLIVWVWAHKMQIPEIGG